MFFDQICRPSATSIFLIWILPDLSLEEYESALIYFRLVLNHYYDTNFADDARIGIIFTHILNKNRQGAISYFQAEKNRFIKPTKYSEAESLINDTQAGLKLAQYYKLYRWNSIFSEAALTHPTKGIYQSFIRVL